MNKDSFYTGLFMLFLPLLLAGIFSISELDINWNHVLYVIGGLVYFGTALYLMIKGMNQDN